MEVVYENATKVDKRVTYTIRASRNQRTVKVEPGGTIRMPVGCGFRIVKTETIE